MPIGKKAIEEFLQKQKEEKKDNALQIKIQNGSMADEKENNNQTST